MLRAKQPFELFEGNEWAVDEALMVGCDGAVCGIGALAPRPLVQIARAGEDGDLAAACDIQHELCEVFTAIYGSASWIWQKFAL